MRNIAKLTDLNTPSDADASQVVADTISGVAHDYHDGLSRSLQWVDGMREGGLYASQLTLAALRSMGMIEVEIDPAALQDQITSLLPRGEK